MVEHSSTNRKVSGSITRGGQTVALSHQSATGTSNCATGGYEKMGSGSLGGSRPHTSSDIAYIVEA